MQVPQGETGRQARLLAQGDWFGEFEEAEVGFAFFGAHAHADELDLGDDEAVAGVAFAHQAVQVGEAGEVEGLLAVFLLAHARVPDFERLDETDDTAAAERVGLVVGVGRLEEWTVFLGALRDHGDVMLVALARLEGCVDFRGVECVDGVLECAFVGWLDQSLSALRLWESSGWNGNVEEAGSFFAVRKVWNGHDGVEAEVFPIFQISYVPPAVHMVTEACGNLLNQCYCRVRSSQVFHNAGCRPIQAKLGSKIPIPG